MYTIAIILALLFYLLSIFVHVLIIRKKIDYTLVNGGRSTSYEEQANTSKTSIVILFIGLIIVLLFAIIPTISTTLFGVILMGVLTLYWTLGLVMQFLGTWLEQRVISIIVFLGVLSHLLIVLEYF